MAETLSFISIAAFAAAGVCLAVAVIIFIRFRIPSVIGDLSGKTARKSIEQMRESNEKSGNKSYRPGKVNAGREKLIDSETVLPGNKDAEEVLQDKNATVALEDHLNLIPKRTGGVSIEILEEVMLVCTDEVIP